MEDLLEELLNVLAKPSPNETTHSAATTSKPLANRHHTSTPQNQRHGLSASPISANPISASLNSQQPADRARENPMSAAAPSNLMNIASLSEVTADSQRQTAQSLAAPEDALVKSMLFDAGIAVSDLSGHQTFSLKDKQTTAKTDAKTEEREQPPNRVRVFVNQQSENAYVTVLEDSENESGIEQDNIAPEDAPTIEDAPMIEETSIVEETPIFEQHDAVSIEASATEIDESVMSAFDIGDFEADTHAVQTEDTTANEEPNSDCIDSSAHSSSDFDPDDLDIGIADLYQLDRRQENADVPDDDFYESDDDINFSDDLLLNASAKPLIGSVADISPDEIEAGRKPNRVTRWFQKWLNPLGEEKPSAQPSEPRLFEDDYAPEADTEAYSDLDTIDEVAFEPEMIPDPPVDDVIETEDVEAEAFESIDETIEASETIEVSETIERFEAAETFDIEESLPEESLPEESLPEESLPEESAQDEALEASEEPSSIEEAEALDLTEVTGEALETAETSDVIEADAEDTADTVAADEIIEPDASETTVSMQAVPLESTLAEDLNIFEPDADLDEEALLLEALGEKSWLSPAENASEALYTSALAGDPSGVWAALEANANINALSKAQRTALSVAVEAGHVPVVRMLLEMCADPNLADLKNGSPASYPLMVAASKTAEQVRSEMVQLLIASGAEVNQANVMGQTALMSAAEQGNIETLRLLLEANASLDAQDLLSQSAIAYAKKSEQAAVVEFLQQTALDREQAIAFLKAVTRGDLEEVRQWLAAGVSANTRVARMSALTQAAAKGEVAIAQLLIDAGADINYQFHPTDPTPLLHAAYRGQAEMVSLLLEAGASTHPTPNPTIGALDYAEIGQKKASNPEAFEPAIALLATLAKRP